MISALACPALVRRAEEERRKKKKEKRKKKIRLIVIFHELLFLNTIVIRFEFLKLAADLLFSAFLKSDDWRASEGLLSVMG